MEKADRPMKAEKEGKETGPSFGTVNFEGRKHPRMAVNLPVEYWKENAPLIGSLRTIFPQLSPSVFKVLENG